MFGLFGNPDRAALSAELVLRFNRGVSTVVEFVDADGVVDDPDVATDNLSALGIVSFSDGSITGISRDAAEDRENTAALQRVSFELSGASSDDSVRTSNILPFTLSNTDLDEIPPATMLQIALDGESEAAGATCLEVGQSVNFDSLLSFPNEGVAPNETTVLPARVSEQTVWSVSDSAVVAVLNEPTLRGRVTAVNTGNANLSASYVKNVEREFDGDTNGNRFSGAASLALTVMPIDQCN